MRHKWLVLVVLLVSVLPATGNDCLCNFVAGGPTALNRQNDPRNYPVLSGTLENLKLDAVLQQTRQVVNFPGRVMIVPMPGLNAFALPNGRIYFTQEMVARRSGDELAGVLGHEMTHYYKQHGKRQLEQSMPWLVGAGVASATTKGDLKKGLLYGLLAGFLFDRAHKSRVSEYEADHGGVVIAAAAGFNALALAGLMDYFGSLQPASSGDLLRPITKNLDSHPPGENRAKKIRQTDTAQLTARNNGNTAHLAESLGHLRVAIRQINLEGSSYTSHSHAYQLIVAALDKYVTVTERPENATFYLDLSGNIAIAANQGGSGVFTRDFDIEVIGGTFRGRASFAGSLVAKNGDIFGATSKPSNESAKRVSGLFVRAGRWLPITVQTNRFDSPEQIVLQQLIEKGIGAWTADLMASHSDRLQPETQPSVLATSRVEPQKVAGEDFFDLDPVPGAYAVLGETWGVYEDGQRIGTVRVRRVEGRRVYCDLVNGRIGGSRSYTKPDN